MKGVLIAAERSGSGKTTITTGIARALSRQGRKVAPFKCGPDYIDSRHLARAAGNPVENLDSVMLDKTTLRQIFAQGCQGRDLALVEGVMGLFDGIEPRRFGGSSYDVAVQLGLPVVVVLNAASCSYTIAALLRGLQSLCRSTPLVGVIVNQLASSNHERLIRSALEQHTDIPVLGSVPRQTNPLAPSRHLGITTAAEMEENYFDACADLVQQHVNLDALSAIDLTSELQWQEQGIPKTTRICAVARDHAFNFYYEANLREIERRGYALRFFSPLAGETVPEADFIYIGGGYPELYAETLSTRQELHQWLLQHSAASRPLLAECGGMMLLTKGIVDGEGRHHPMTGIFAARCRMTGKRQALGYVQVQEPISLTGLVGHEFRYSTLEDVNEPYVFTLEKVTNGARSRDGFIKSKTLAGYVHFHFSSQPSLLDWLLK
ncbi:cobyrinate a,c-diamide synthase [Geoalkalibacter subterraneus]|uniref:Cobyrinate a,c-diamide synthase n=1 Tax=Geoalkalibacter subterraneus TaxID=483547 RepID=A0A0B5FDY3_9BACT|nr:cobyrinate a,c-diamide synthase [Geoalkalibacter subterraneus]AJF05498.1 cobyrinic acid a,c-diamide synthase [Geoalkalibacter subterraneus]